MSIETAIEKLAEAIEKVGNLHYQRVGDVEQLMPFKEKEAASDKAKCTPPEVKPKKRTAITEPLPEQTQKKVKERATGVSLDMLREVAMGVAEEEKSMRSIEAIIDKYEIKNIKDLRENQYEEVYEVLNSRLAELIEGDGA